MARKGPIILTVTTAALVVAVVVLATALYSTKTRLTPAGDLAESGRARQTYRLDNLDVSIYDLRNPSFGISTVTLRVVVSVFNANAYMIDSPRIVYEAYINDIHVGSGKTYLPDIPPDRSRRYDAGFLVSYVDLGASLLESIRQGSFRLRIQGHVSSRGQRQPFQASWENR